MSSLFLFFALYNLSSSADASKDRYATEPKKQLKFIQRASGKMTCMAKNSIKKLIEFKSFTVSKTQHHINFKDGEFEVNPFNGVGCKKTSFVVSKRKGNKSLIEESTYKNQQKKTNNEWIQSIQHESYQGFRDYNEDRILIKQGINAKDQLLNIFAVFDGHGGSSASEYLKLHFVKTFESFIQNFSIQQALKKTILQLQNRIMKCGTKINSGSCATILITKQNEYWAANVGDSRILIVKDIDQFVQITQDHKPQNLKEYKRIEGLGGKIYRNLLIDENTKQKSYGPFRVMPSKLSVTRAIGDYTIKKNQADYIISADPQIYSGHFDYNDVILLFSDGAYQQFSNEELSILFSQQSRLTLRQRINNFIYSAKKRQTNDNTSIIGIQVKDKEKSPQTSASSGEEPSFLNLQIKSNFLKL